jgi:uncharacterized peroxidase-related enzyme
MKRFTPMRSEDVCEELQDTLPGTYLGFDDQPEFFRMLAKSRVALEAYAAADKTLAHGNLSAQDRSRIALAVSEINGSSYDSAVQSRIAKETGLAEHDIDLARTATATDAKALGLLRFVQALVLQRGQVADEDFQALRRAGFAESEIVEIVANVAVNIFANYLNLVAGTDAAAAARPELCERRPVAGRNGTSVRVNPQR